MGEESVNFHRPRSGDTIPAMIRCLPILAVLLLGGCVDRLVNVRSEPPGASVYMDDVKVGETPCDVQYIWYGQRELVIELRGYRIVRETIVLRPPWWQFFPLDLITDVVLPFTVTDQVEVSYSLERERASGEEVEPILKRADELRKRLEESKP